MGSRNRDRIPLAYRRSKCETVADMRQQGWDVLSRCDACGLIMRVDLALIERVSGPETSLWNHRARCRRVGCTGHVDFLARAPGMGWHDVLRAE
jgi:hypothetical protein